MVFTIDEIKALRHDINHKKGYLNRTKWLLANMKPPNAEDMKKWIKVREDILEKLDKIEEILLKQQEVQSHETLDKGNVHPAPSNSSASHVQ